MPSRKNLRHRIKARRETALFNLERRLADEKYWDKMSDEGKGIALAKAKAEATVLQSRVGGGA